MCALAYAVMLISKFIPEVAGFLQLDFKDVIIVTGGFILGPVYAVIISIIVPLIEMLTVSNTGAIGMLMNVVATISFCYTASYVYYKFHSFKGAVAGLVAGTLMLTAVMLLWNRYLTPIYMKVPKEVVIAMLPTVFLPFNLVKGLINSAFALILYRPLIKTLSKAKLIESNSANKSSRAFLPSVVLGLIVLAACIPALLYILK